MVTITGVIPRPTTYTGLWSWLTTVDLPEAMPPVSPIERIGVSCPASQARVLSVMLAGARWAARPTSATARRRR